MKRIIVPRKHDEVGAEKLATQFRNLSQELGEIPLIPGVDGLRLEIVSPDGKISFDEGELLHVSLAAGRIWLMSLSFNEDGGVDCMQEMTKKSVGAYPNWRAGVRAILECMNNEYSRLFKATAERLAVLKETI